ncbi:LysM peptidoglycan-binding domain-containing protein [Microbacterium tumbae]
MSPTTKRARSRQLQIGVPAAIIGSLAGVLTAAPAMAAEPGAVGASGLASPAPAGRTAPAAPQAPAGYTVRSGDTVWAIAQRFGLRTADVLAWNGLSAASVIHPGQVLRLRPGASSPQTPATSASATHTVVAGDTIYGIAKKYGKTVAAVLSANGLSSSSIIHPGQKVRLPGAQAPAQTAAPAPASTTHAVSRGDTVFGIAQRYGTTVTAVLAANGLSSSSIIYPGQRLEIPSTTAGSLNSRQAENARMIIRIGRELGVSDRGIAIALATSMVEAWMRNLDWGDRDSLGLFQQRPSQGWGTPAQIRDRDYSIRAFYGGPSDPNGSETRGLLDIPGWESMGFSEAAQSVQISQYPERYGQWETQAYRWLEQYG